MVAALLTQMRAQLAEADISMKVLKAKVAGSANKEAQPYAVLRCFSAGIVAENEFPERAGMRPLIAGQVAFMYSDLEKHDLSASLKVERFR